MLVVTFVGQLCNCIGQDCHDILTEIVCRACVFRNPADEMFDINTDLDLLAGLDLPQPDEPAVSNVTRPADSAITRTTATMSQAQQVGSMLGLWQLFM